MLRMLCAWLMALLNAHGRAPQPIAEGTGGDPFSMSFRSCFPLRESSLLHHRALSAITGLNAAQQITTITSQVSLLPFSTQRQVRAQASAQSATARTAQDGSWGIPWESRQHWNCCGSDLALIWLWSGSDPALIWLWSGMRLAQFLCCLGCFGSESRGQVTSLEMENKSLTSRNNLFVWYTGGWIPNSHLPPLQAFQLLTFDTDVIYNVSGHRDQCSWPSVRGSVESNVEWWSLSLLDVFM